MSRFVRIFVALLLASWQVVVPGTRNVCICLCGRGGICWDLEMPGIDCCLAAEQHGSVVHNDARGGSHGVLEMNQHALAWSPAPSCGCRHLELASAQAGAVCGPRLLLPEGPVVAAAPPRVVFSLGCYVAGAAACVYERPAPVSEAEPLVLRC